LIQLLPPALWLCFATVILISGSAQTTDDSLLVAAADNTPARLVDMAGQQFLSPGSNIEPQKMFKSKPFKLLTSSRE
jgi:hypothetical protein